MVYPRFAFKNYTGISEFPFRAQVRTRCFTLHTTVVCSVLVATSRLRPRRRLEFVRYQNCAHTFPAGFINRLTWVDCATAHTDVALARLYSHTHVNDV
jgi:hypothetical protein